MRLVQVDDIFKIVHRFAKLLNASIEEDEGVSPRIMTFFR